MSKYAVMAAAAMSLMLAAPVAASGTSDACAAKLTADGKAIYAAAMAAKPTAQNLLDTMERETKSLAMGNKIARGSARDNARAAMECVQLGL